MDDSIEKLAIKNKEDIASLKEQIALQNEIDNKNAEIKMLTLKNELGSQINAVANSSALGIQTNAGAISNLQNVINNLTQVIIPTKNVCNTCCGCGCNSQQ